MGWWSIRKDTREVFDPAKHPKSIDQSELLEVGDQPMDAIEAALTKVIELYKKDLKRKPTPDELSALLESSVTHQVVIDVDQYGPRTQSRRPYWSLFYRFLNRNSVILGKR